MTFGVDLMEDDQQQEIARLIEQLTKEQLQQLKDYLHNVIHID
jgi:trans-2-enoyl-CoA reductase